ncbi:hypothetical protein R5R35_007211 [Gryllus longicercus]|uniref:Kelch-like protein diablo n=1 Tax=Gryllus longicercus TaxID=2509291 RepID=A0AAN9Z5U7_9ORTH
MDLTMKHRKLTRNRSPPAVPTSNKTKHNKKKKALKYRKCVCSPSSHGHVDFPRVWNELRLRQQLCDGIIHSSDGKALHVHRALLSAASSHFKALFTAAHRSSRSETNEVNVDISSELLELILDYAYTGRCNVTLNNVQQLLPASDRYAVFGVVQQCCAYLIEEMRPDNCLGIFRFACPYFCSALEERGRRYIAHNFKNILDQSTEFFDLTAEELDAILSDDELNVAHEEVVFDSITKWIDADPDLRRPWFGTLIHSPRYGLMSFKFFTESVMSNPYICENADLQNSLYPASLFLAKLDSKRGSEVDLNDPVARPRIPYEILFAIGGWSAGSPTSFVETYDTRADRWFLSVNTDVTPRAYHGLCALDSLIYMIGGFDGNEHFNSVRCFNPITRKWKERACMYHARCYVSVCTLGGRIYAMGGYNGRTRMNSAERYNPNSNQWEIIPSMQRQRSDASAAALNDKIYIVGGFNGQEVLSSAEMFDPLSNQWSYIHPMTSARSGVSLVAYKGCLYALGGFNGFTRLNTGEKYDPSQSLDWHEVTEMFSPRSNFATVVLDDMIFVIGGFNGTTTIAYVECYDAETNEWYDASPMNLNRSALSACVIPGLPNAREYSYLSKAQEIGQGASSDAASH